MGDAALCILGPSPTICVSLPQQNCFISPTEEVLNLWGGWVHKFRTFSLKNVIFQSSVSKTLEMDIIELLTKKSLNRPLNRGDTSLENTLFQGFYTKKLSNEFFKKFALWSRQIWICGSEVIVQNRRSSLVYGRPWHVYDRYIVIK